MTQLVAFPIACPRCDGDFRVVNPGASATYHSKLTIRCTSCFDEYVVGVDLIPIPKTAIAELDLTFTPEELEERLQKAHARIVDGARIKRACQEYGLSTGSYYRWLERRGACTRVA